MSENKAQEKTNPAKSGERIAKRIAAAGICSRRDAEKLIAEGRVKVNGNIIDSPALNVTDKDNIKVDNKLIDAPAEIRLFLYHKPSGLVTTHKDEKDRKTVFEALPKTLPRVVSVGRLDMTTEGLLLLTTSGELSRFLELPGTGWVRRYRVRVFGRVEDNHIKKLEKGIKHDGVQYGSIQAVVDGESGANTWLTLSLKEGKNREIRNVMEALGLKVNRLIRTSYGPFQLGNLAKGTVKEIPKKALKEQIPKTFWNGK